MAEQVFLPHPESNGDTVDFGIKHGEVNGDHVLTERVENSLAHAVGIQNDDVLVRINGTNIERRDSQYLLQLLREEVKPSLLLTVKRQTGDGIYKFIWTFFEVFIKDGHADVKVIYHTETDEDVMPWIDITDAQLTGYEWLGKPVEAYEIYIDEHEAPDLYLSIGDESLLEFVPHDNSKSTFYRYNYATSGVDPKNGNVVVYSQQPPGTKDEALTTPAAVSTDRNPEIAVLDFPARMEGDSIPLNPRFWYEKRFGNGISLQNVEQKGWYLYKSTSGSAAALFDRRKKLQVSPQ